jgi:hypothetical protein
VLRESLAEIDKIATKNVQIFTLTTLFFFFFYTHSNRLLLFSLNIIIIIIVLGESVKERGEERMSKRKKMSQKKGL